MQCLVCGVVLQGAEEGAVEGAMGALARHLWGEHRLFSVVAGSVASAIVMKYMRRQA